MSFIQSWQSIGLLIKYWLKGRFTKASALGILLGEIAISAFVLFAGGTFLSFSTRFGQSGGVQLSEVSWSLVLSFYLIGLIQTGFSGYGLPITSADVDYVFTSPLKTTQVFAAKVLQSSVMIILVFPPIFLLYLRSALFYGTSVEAAILAELVTLVFFVMGLVLSADVTLALRPGADRRRTNLLKYIFAGAIFVVSLLPLIFLVPGAPTSLLSLTRVFPSGIVAQISIGLISGLPFSSYAIDFALLAIWFAALLLIGFRLSKRQFYEILQVSTDGAGSNTTSELQSQLNGKSLWGIVGTKEKLVMNRTREGRGFLFSALILSVFLVVYALAGAFTASHTSFLFILFVIGSFGSGNAWSWMEKERLWILKTSSISLRRYVKQVFITRVTPLLAYLAPAVVTVGSLLVYTNFGNGLVLLRISVALFGAMQIAAITMGGSMYFASRYAQSSNADLLSPQGQDMSNLKRTIFQTIVNLLLVAPIMLLVLTASWVGVGFMFEAGVGISLASIVYSVIILNVVLNKAGDTILEREDL